MCWGHALRRRQRLVDLAAVFADDAAIPDVMWQTVVDTTRLSAALCALWQDLTDRELQSAVDAALRDVNTRAVLTSYYREHSRVDQDLGRPRPYDAGTCATRQPGSVW